MELRYPEVTILYPATDEETKFPALGHALEDTFNPERTTYTNDQQQEVRYFQCAGVCQLSVHQPLGSDDSLYFKVFKDGQVLFDLVLDDRYDIDALRRYCEMALDHIGHLEQKHGPIE